MRGNIGKKVVKLFVFTEQLAAPANTRGIHQASSRRTQATPVHPRIRGEYQGGGCAMAVRGGSPPHTRGIRQFTELARPQVAAVA